MTKEQRKIKELTAQVEDLTRKLADVTSDKESWYSRYREVEKQLEDLHSVFDLLNVPRTNKSSGYSSSVSIGNRMTLYVAGIRDNTENKEN